MEDKKIGLIGCGPSGMALISAFHEANSNGKSVPKIICFEKQEKVSGLWNLTWKTGIDSNGEPVHSSMYRHQWANGPKECLELANYTFDEHFKKPVPSFPPRGVIQDYLLGRFEKCSKDQDIRFNTVVRNVVEDSGRFIITYENLLTKERCDEIVDYVIVATGHFSVPFMPSYPGLESFNGSVLHSHDFRNAEEFKDKRVVIVGSKYSAEDIALQCSKFGAKKCIISYRKNKIGFKWPENIIEVPQCQKIVNKHFFFEDGSIYEADAIIFCTGYNHHYPFLENKLRLKDATNLVYLENLYKGIVLKNNKNVLYLGAQNQCYTFPMFDIQAWFARDVILGNIEIPDEETMNKDINTWFKRCMNLKSNSGALDFQKEYLHDLMKETNYSSFEIISKIAEMYHTCNQDKIDDIMTYRDKCFTSPYTGTVAVTPRKNWFDSLDDSREYFMREN